MTFRSRRFGPGRKDRGATPPETFVALDVETTGLSRKARVLEVGIAFFRRGYHQGHWDSLIDPQTQFKRGVSRISQEDVADAPTFADVYPIVFSMLDGVDVVGHNVAFDLRMIAYECSLIGRPPPTPISTWCTMKLAGGKLKDLAARLGVEEEWSHSALGDAIVAGKCFVEITGGSRGR